MNCSISCLSRQSKCERTVFFGKKRTSYIDCQSRGQAELVERAANLGVTGEVKLPTDLAPCFQLLDRMKRRIERATARFDELARSRTGDERIQDQLLEVLQRWFVLGRSPAKPAGAIETE
jgi:hypothetical protein